MLRNHVLSMTVDERAALIKRGGAQKTRAERQFNEWLRNLKLSQEAEDFIAETDSTFEWLYNCNTPEEVEEAVTEINSFDE